MAEEEEEGKKNGVYQQTNGVPYLLHSVSVRVHSLKVVQFTTAHPLLALVNECLLQHLDALDQRAVQEQDALHRSTVLHLRRNVVTIFSNILSINETICSLTFNRRRVESTSLFVFPTTTPFTTSVSVEVMYGNFSI